MKNAFTIKSFLFSLLFSCITFLGFSQFRMGVQAGVAISNANRSVPGISIPGLSFGSSSIAGVVAGVTGSLPVWERIEFRPEINFIQRGAHLTSSFISYTIEGKYTLNYADIPLNVVYGFNVGKNKLYAGLGPEVAFGLSGKGKGDNNQDIKIKFDGKDTLSTDYIHLKAPDFGLSFCLGFQFKNGMFLDGGYFLGLTDIDPNKDFVWKNHGFTIKLGYLFNKW